MASEFLPTALEAVKAAEEILLHYYKEDVRVRLKPDQTPVSVADEEAEALIRKIIAQKYPGHGFIGEEEGRSNEGAEYQWIIDPIDATKNYVRRIPLFGSLLALMRNGEIILGISNVPLMTELIYAEKGGGAFLNEERLRVSKIQNLNEAWITFGGFTHFAKHDKLNGVVSLINATKRQRAFGDLWQYHLVAQGKFDAVIEAHVKLWDVAPAAIIIEEAGGRVTDLAGNPIGLETRSVVASNGLIHDQLLQQFRPEIGS